MFPAGFLINGLFIRRVEENQLMTRNSKINWMRRPGSLNGVVVCIGLLMAVWAALSASGATIWDGGNNTGWWYDPVNWNANSNDNMTLPNTGLQNNQATEIDDGYGVSQTDGSGDGVIFDPDNDPNFAIDSANNVPPAPNLNPYQMYRFYLSNGASSSTFNKLTVKSGELDFSSQVRIARTANTTGIIAQSGGTVNLQDTDNGSYLSLGDTTDATGIYNYSGGNLYFQTPASGSSPGIRLGNVAFSTGKFIDQNTGAAGAIQVANFYAGYMGIGIMEYHYGLDQSSHGDIRPIQIVGVPTTGETSNGQFALRNALSDGMTPLTQASELSLVLDAAPTVSGGLPQNLGLVSFVSGASGIKGLSTNPKIFYETDAITPYNQGSTVSATFGGTTYDWTISYTGQITYSDAATSAISSISGIGGTDIVLIGESVSSSILLGDMNFDGHVDAKDLAALELALTNKNGYLSTDFGNGTPGSHGVTSGNIGSYADVSGGGNFNNADLQSLEVYLIAGHGSASAVPEPASFVLAGLGAVALCLFGRRRCKIA
jgi:hypothetical protein